MKIELGDQLEPKDIFVSYSRRDSEKLRPIVNAIAAAGASLWIDTEAIDGAALWGAEIVKAITGAKVMLVACSPAAFESHNVTKEISLASEKRKSILPLFIEPTTVPANVEYQLAGIQRIEIYRGDSEKNIIAVLRALRRLGVDFRPPEQPATPDFQGWVTPDQARRAMKTGDGKGIRIALFDSGIEVSHPALKGMRLIDDLAVIDDGPDLSIVEGGGIDVYGHGTANAGLIHSVAPAAEIGSFRVLGENLGSRTVIVKRGVREALDRNYDILMASFGCGLSEHIFQYKEWVDEACLKGVHIVTGCNSYDYKIPEWPAYFPTVLSVNAARTKEDLLYRTGDMIRLAAPGIDVDVPWKDGGRKEVTGSAFAAARVAGYLANILSECGPIPPLLVHPLLQKIATPWSGDNAGVIINF
jgi:subtilisin family serine protease